MQRVTVTLPDSLCAELDRYMTERHYPNRSEAMRDLLRAALRDGTAPAATGAAMGVLSYVYDHDTRDLSRRLMHHHHDHHDIGLTTTHVHLDHDTCLEVALLRGAGQALQAHADRVLAERGVRHGHLFLIPVEEHAHTHPHGDPDSAAPHDHVHVKDSF
jgi:CopG family transcriptional regulator, nickel-responsive regulator